VNRSRPATAMRRPPGARNSDGPARFENLAIVSVSRPRGLTNPDLRKLVGIVEVDDLRIRRGTPPRKMQGGGVRKSPVMDAVRRNVASWRRLEEL
jgi:hypothetical protein